MSNESLHSKSPVRVFSLYPQNESPFRSVVLVAAHCVSDSPKQSISMAPKDDVDLPLAAENVIIHPEYNETAPGGQHDLAVLKVKATDNDEHNYACLPEIGDDPMDGCQGGQLNLTLSKTNI